VALELQDSKLTEDTQFHWFGKGKK